MRIPRGMVKRPQRGWYVRRRVDGKIRWIALGKKFDVALQRYRGLEFGDVPRSRTIRQATPEWLETYIRANRNEKNQLLTARRVALYLNEYMGYKRIDRVSAEDIRKYRLWLETQVAPQTVVHLLSDLRCLLNWSAGMGYGGRFPRRALPRIQERPPDRLADEDAAALLAAPEPYGFCVRFLLATGLRWGEAVRATGRDVQGEWLVVHQTKSGKVRRVPLPEEFRRRVGRFVPYKEAASFARTTGQKTGVTFHVHQLRHTFACRWLERGGSLVALQAILGHSTIVTTQRYGRLSESHVLAEAKRVGCEPACEPGTQGAQS